MAKTKMPWFRVYTEMVDDEKLRILAFEDRWHFVAILCCKRAGMLDADDSPKMLCRKLAIKLGLHGNELELVASRLAEVGLIDEKTFQPVAWSNRQFDSDSDPTAASRKRKQRANSTTVTRESRGTVTNVTRTDTDTDTDTDKERSRALVQQAARPADRFPDFWLVYPRHIARKAAVKAWLAAKPDDAMADRIIAAVKAQTPGFLRRDKDKIPHAATWLNAERWNDEVEVMRTGPPTNGTMSKALSGIQKLQAMRINEREQPRLAAERDSQRAIEADDPEPRPPARCGPD